MGSSPFTCVLGGIVALVIGTIVRFRLLGVLSGETILSGGEQVPMAEFADRISLAFFVAGAVFIAIGLVWLATLSQERRRKLAALPRAQRFLFWPIERHIAPRE